MSSNTPNQDFEEKKPDGDETPRVLRAEELFLGKRQVWIELDGVRYQLRITKRGKLILQK
jgi:hemin uptake protein HemP